MAHYINFSMPADDAETTVLSVLNVCEMHKEHKVISYLNFMSPLSDTDRKVMENADEQVFNLIGTRTPTNSLCFAYSDKIAQYDQAAFDIIRSRHKGNKTLSLLVWEEDEISKLQEIAAQIHEKRAVPA